MYGTRLYHIWNGLRGRCLNPNNKDYTPGPTIHNGDENDPIQNNRN